MVAPKRPSSRMRSTSGCGYSSACSYLLATGITSRVTKRRTVSSTCAVTAGRSSTAAPAMWSKLTMLTAAVQPRALNCSVTATTVVSINALDSHPVDGRPRRRARDGARVDAAARAGAPERRHGGVHGCGRDRPGGDAGAPRARILEGPADPAHSGDAASGPRRRADAALRRPPGRPRAARRGAGLSVPRERRAAESARRVDRRACGRDRGDVRPRGPRRRDDGDADPRRPDRLAASSARGRRGARADAARAERRPRGTAAGAEDRRPRHAPRRGDLVALPVYRRLRPGGRSARPAG